VLFPDEALFFGRGDDLAVDQQCCRRIVIQRSG
jgi:DNA-directed RNA polymerase subunit N (RpoN/RPB10)